ncbi:hypothetical protein [Nesterenkonia flava]|uniref:Uncharacterized protein n=1 Tax=Nesterenkonia flava TaxID=469799 RepID=A0ABU1FTC1_9MICC|nr:hypothetical protein [Nesterenkonia flava]MDR5711386.1 hypothetical protein [Nesterenkonia flava]
MTEALQTIIPLATALGLGTILPKLVQWIIDKITRRDEEERNAWRQRDIEAQLRREYEEVLHETRLQWHRETGKEFGDMPMPPAPK